LPSKVVVLSAIGVGLQYAVVALLYYFLFLALKAIYRDLKGARSGRPAPVAPAAAAEGAEAARLTVVDSGPVALDKPVYTLGETTAIGRGEDNDIVVRDSFVSHEHALITRYKQGYWLTDLKSTNGTFHNNRRVTDEVALHNGDLLVVGAVIFRFER